MTAEELRAHLRQLGWKQIDLVRRLNEAADYLTATSTVNRWAQGRPRVPAGVAAYLRLALRVKQLGL